MTKIKELIKNLLKGKIPLKIVFWIYFILVTFLLNIFIQIDLNNSYYELTFNKTQTYINLALFFLLFIYTIFIFIAVIKSANQYKGSKFLAFLAKLTVTINLISTLFSTLDILKVYYFEDYFIGSQIKAYKAQLPIKVNSYTNLKNIDKIENKILYTYQIVNKKFSHIANLNLKSFKKDVQNSLCEDETTLDLLKKDYVLKYSYLDEKGNKLINIDTTKKTCGPSIYDLDILKEILSKQGQM
ncbi:hypothetical protein ACH5BK_00595 [Arcobacter sp. YIC-80]|uniref:hypothetical protein n=1 Tax=Arcobacter sp. YIC-80 TaxID=3376683 RepID=UPI00384C817A